MTDSPPTEAQAPQQSVPASQIFSAFLKLGLTSFGGPIAHLGYFRDEFVSRRKWFDERAYADLVALCQFLPGPSSSQVGMGIGFSKGGLPGALAAWVAFTAPSAILLMLAGFSMIHFSGIVDAGWVHGLKLVAVAIVAQAVWGMAGSLCPDRPRATLAILATIIVLAYPSPFTQVGAIVIGGVAGRLVLKPDAADPGTAFAIKSGRTTGIAFLALFFVLLISLPLLRPVIGDQGFTMFDSFYRSGSLVFGGGHVVLPLLQSEVVPPGWVSKDLFLAGYGAAQAIPGPLFTFSSYLGVVMSPEPNGWIGGLICLVAIFLPSFLLIIGALPFWEALRQKPQVQTALAGVNASVVGLLLAALYDPVFTSAVRTPVDFCIALAGFGLLMYWKTPPWVVVILTMGAGAAAAALA